jgi:pimeloyl-ACP methyl ester carboxylesterase
VADDRPSPIIRSTVTLECGAAADGRQLPAVDALIDTPASPTGRVILFHGFGRGPGALDLLADALVASGLWVLRPHLKSRPIKGGMNDVDLMAAVALAAARVAPEVGPLSLVAHSAGGAVGMRGAQALIAAGIEIKGLVLLDANGSIEKIMDPALASLASAQVPVRTVAAAPGRCNRQAQIADWLAAGVDGFAGVRMRSGMHCDAEDAKADRTCRLLCGGTPDPANAAVLRVLTVGWTRGWVDGQEDVDLLPGGRRLQVWEDLDVIEVMA